MIYKHLRSLTTTLTTACLVLSSLGDVWAAKTPNPAESYTTTTPIKHLVVIFQENVSFHHYFGTYPYANNPASQPAFHADPKTPRVNNLLSSGLLTENPNSVQPFRLDRAQAVTCDQNHNYGPEQKSFNLGAMDKFPEFVGQGTSVAFPCADFGKGAGIGLAPATGRLVAELFTGTPPHLDPAPFRVDRPGLGRVA